MTWADMLSDEASVSRQYDASECCADVHVVLDRRKESPQPFIRGSVRKITSKDLMSTCQVVKQAKMLGGKP